jgi:hypothetical protein
MGKTVDEKIALVALIAFAVWLFVVLPLLYLPSQVHVHGEILEVKYGEWLLFLATMALFWATWRLVKGAEKTAERQLRAYVFVQPVGIDILDAGDSCNVTPCYRTSEYTASLMGARERRPIRGRGFEREHSLNRRG